MADPLHHRRRYVVMIAGLIVVAIIIIIVVYFLKTKYWYDCNLWIWWIFYKRSVSNYYQCKT